jgi:multiple sugar transport system substrate-binding protein
MTSKQAEPIIGGFHGGAARVSTWSNSDYTDKLNPEYVATVLAAMQTSRPTVVFREGWSEYALAIVDSIQAMYGGTAPEEAVNTAQERITELVNNS